MRNSSDLNATIEKGAAEALALLERAAKVIDAEWRRAAAAVDESDTVPEQVKQAFARLDDAADTVRDEASNVAESLPGNLADAVDELVRFVAQVAPGCAATSQEAPEPPALAPDEAAAGATVATSTARAEKETKGRPEKTAKKKTKGSAKKKSTGKGASAAKKKAKGGGKATKASAKRASNTKKRS